jgi:alkanesulfonate monooxygenase SsuD/methylene tetrahydromethanopterin reductase-like flavin-dependent oxidoreductase (luciferase family)
VRVGLTVGAATSIKDEARAAEQRGFDLLGCGEHVFFHGPTVNSLAALAVAAGATERIGLVSSVALLPLYPAAQLAKLAMTIDQAAGGRFELGLGAGGEFPAEFEACGVDPATRFRRLDEGLAVIRELFSGAAVSMAGEFATLSGMALQPGPSRPGGPPIWLAGRKAKARERAGRFADVWLPYMVDPDQVRDGLARVREAAVTAGRLASSVSGALFIWTRVDESAARAREDGIEIVSKAYQQDFTRLADRYLLLGDPARLVSRLGEYADAGVDTVLLQPAASPGDDRERVVAAIADEVLPRLKRA